MDNIINKRILDLCNQKGWSVYKLSKESGIQNSTINAMFKNNHTPNFYSLQKICDGLQITLSGFFDCELFNCYPTSIIIDMWNKLNGDDKEKVLIYMHGLLHKEIPKEGLNDELRGTIGDSQTTYQKK